MVKISFNLTFAYFSPQQQQKKPDHNQKDISDKKDTPKYVILSFKKY